MYYYIIEVSPQTNLARLQTQLRQILGSLDISGEMAVASPARSADELANIGLAKGYTTIVAIGGDSLVNTLASIVARTPAVLGVIPVNLSPGLANLFTGNNIKSACLSLRKRATKLVDLANILPNKYFLSDAIITPPEIIPINLEVDGRYQLYAKISSMTITSSLKTSFSSASNNDTGKSSWWKKLSRPAAEPHMTIIHPQNLMVNTSQPVPVIVAGNIIAKTPIHVKKEPKCLKIITDHDTIE